MGVTNNLSKSQTNNQAIPRVLNSSHFERGTVQISSGKAVVLTTDSNGSTYNICRLPANARVVGIKLTCPAITGGTSWKCGTYKDPQDGGTAVSDACFFTGVDLSTAIPTPTEKYGVGITYDPEKRIWEVEGDTVDPKQDRDIVLTGTTIGSAGGTITVDVTWTW